MGIVMNVSKLDGIKEIKMAQKKLSFQLRQDQ